MKTRKTVVAGRFYPSDKKELSALIKKISKSEKSKINTKLSEKKIIGAVVPHAGYIFSGYQAVHFFEILKLSKQKFDTFVIINPNHTSIGKNLSVDDNDFWDTPYGKIPVDKEFCTHLKLSESADSHKHEHSGEVMLPFLKYYIDYDFSIVPISISHQNYENSRIIAEKIYNAEKKLSKKICIIASSDFSHYVSPSRGEKYDKKVIDKILAFDAESMINTVKNHNISMCGYGPVASLIEYSKLKYKNPKANLLKFGHSGEVMPSDEVVDYASILISE